jgi:hypothetical protein
MNSFIDIMLNRKKCEFCLDKTKKIFDIPIFFNKNRKTEFEFLKLCNPCLITLVKKELISITVTDKYFD